MEKINIEKLVKNLIDKTSESDISSLHVEFEGVKISIEKAVIPTMAPVYVEQVSANVVPARASEVPEPNAEPEKEQYKVVESPIVGTFYVASSPDEEPFVTVGQRVKKGDILCIVEAMKMMNEIECEFDGVIKEILAENGQLIEYGQAIMKIE